MITAELIDRLVEATNEAKATVREMHEARRDARQALKDLNHTVDTIRREVIEGQAELVRQQWERTDLTKYGDLLKTAFGSWTDQLAKAAEVLDSLHAKDDRLAEQLARIESRVQRAL